MTVQWSLYVSAFTRKRNNCWGRAGIPCKAAGRYSVCWLILTSLVQPIINESVNVSTHWSLHTSIPPSISPIYPTTSQSINPSIDECVNQLVWQSVYPYIHPSIFFTQLSISQSNHPICLSMCLPVHPSISQSFHNMFIEIHPTMHPSVWSFNTLSSMPCSFMNHHTLSSSNCY